jgi:hypothetical protein
VRISSPPPGEISAAARICTLNWKVPGTNYNEIVPAEGLIPNRPAT